MNHRQPTSRWLAPLGVGLAFASAAMAWSLFGGRFLGVDSWIIPGDFWFGAKLADYVAAGALGYVYEADARYLSLPGWPILLAPAAEVVHGLDLLLYEPGLPIGRPSSWPVFGMYSSLVTSLIFVPFDRALPEPSLRRLAALGFVAYVPLGVVAGHYEDVLALAMIVGSEVLRRRRQFGGSAWLLGAAICFKTSAALAVAVHLALVPRDKQFAALMRMAVPPMVLAALPLLTDWTNASRNLFSSGTDLRYGHVLPFLDAGRGWIDAGGYRTAGLLLALIVGGFTSRCLPRNAPAWLPLSFVFLLRALTEPTLHPYYLAPAITFTALAWFEHRPMRLLPVAAVAAQVIAYVRWGSDWWWALFWPLAGVWLTSLVAAIARPAGKMTDVHSVTMR